MIHQDDDDDDPKIRSYPTKPSSHCILSSGVVCRVMSCATLSQIESFLWALGVVCALVTKPSATRRICSASRDLQQSGELNVDGCDGWGSSPSGCHESTSEIMSYTEQGTVFSRPAGELP